MKNNSYQKPASFRSKARPVKRKQISSINPNDLVRIATVTEEESFIAESTFADLKLNERLQENIDQKGYLRPTRIQEQTIPAIREGRNLIGIASTGTGKTGAFLIPLIEQLQANRTLGHALIVVPTRELALQVEEEFQSLTKGLGLYSGCFIGGTNVQSDIRNLKRGKHIIIGTPGRLLDLMNQKALDISGTRALVLDEFDKMLDMGFVRDIERIVAAMKSRKQTMLFSATIEPGQEPLIVKLVEAPVRVNIHSGLSTSDRVNQDVIRVKTGENKFDVLRGLLQGSDFERVLIFTETKHQANKLAKQLNASSVAADMIHGNKSQNYRVNALNSFKSGKIRVLVATDVAARGIDVENVSHVINYQLPLNWDSYVHRIGRTGRAGKSGQAFTFIDE